MEIPHQRVYLLLVEAVTYRKRQYVCTAGKLPEGFRPVPGDGGGGILLKDHVLILIAHIFFFRLAGKRIPDYVQLSKLLTSELGCLEGNSGGGRLHHFKSKSPVLASKWETVFICKDEAADTRAAARREKVGGLYQVLLTVGSLEDIIDNTEVKLIIITVYKLSDPVL